MPDNLSFPGVYIEEIGSSTIIREAPSTHTAFVGRCRKGPVGVPTFVTSFAEFQLAFGSIWKEAELPYAVQDYFNNGGKHAVVLRLVAADDSGNVARPARLHLPCDAGIPLTLEAASPGSWGSAIICRVERRGEPGRFDLTMLERPGGIVERFERLTLGEGNRRVDDVLAANSQLCRVSGALPTSTVLGTDEVARRQLALTDAEIQSVTPFSPSDKRSTFRPGDRTPNAPVRSLAVLAADVGTDGGKLESGELVGDVHLESRSGIYALGKGPQFQLLCLPPESKSGVLAPEIVAAASAYCEERRAFLLLDPPPGWLSSEAAISELSAYPQPKSANAALYFPRIRRPDLDNHQKMRDFAPCGAVAGVIVRTDLTRGVWKAPAGTDATLIGVPGLAVTLSDAQCGLLNPLGINCLRSTVRPVGKVVWGARTLDIESGDWKYIPVRRLALWLEESLYEGLAWVVFEPNEENTWAQIRLAVGSFLQECFRNKAFAGNSPREAYFVKCDATNNTSLEQKHGPLYVEVGFAPIKPAEFITIRIQIRTAL